MSKHYFDNDRVEELLKLYLRGGCVDVALRDEIMSHATALITGVVNSKGYARMFTWRSEENLQDLVNLAWTRIEQTLYKYVPGRGKVFSWWTQIVVLVCLAYTTRESKDRRRLDAYNTGERPHPCLERIECPNFYKVMDELGKICEWNEKYVEMLEFVRAIYEGESAPWHGAIWKLQRRFGKKQTWQFLDYIRAKYDPWDGLAA